VKGLLVGVMLVGLIGSAVPAWAAAPPVSFGVELGPVSRDIEEEGDLVVGTQRGVADSTQLIARLSLQVAPMLIAFGQIGLADLSVDEFQDYRSDLHPLYGGGLRVLLSEGGYGQPVTVYSDLKVLRVKTDDRICVANCDDPVLLPTVVDEEISWTEYAVSLGVKGRYEGFRPFGGLRVSKIDGTDRIGSQTAEIRERDMLGFFFGADIPLDRVERTAITVQISGVDENAFRVGYKVAF